MIFNFLKIYKRISVYGLMKKGRIHITIDKDILDEFRENFIRKKGDISEKIQKMMIKENKQSRGKRNE